MANKNIGKIAHIGGEAKQAGREKRQFDAAKVLPPMAETERRLEMICDLAVSGVLPGSQASAAVRACEAYLKARQLDLDVRRIKDLEKMIGELERELKKARAGHLRAV
jgi:hypothetical protein